MERFDFSRARGVVWVCDVQSSSKYLNDDSLADELETFLPRLYWTSQTLIEEAGGSFLKWTGDGFLAWFETPLHRDIGKTASAVFSAIEHLTLIVNITQLGTNPGKKFRIRHGVSYEHDALLTRITHGDGHEDLDVMGRAVVLSFRMSGIPAKFPGILAQGEVVKGYIEAGGDRIHFRKWTPNKEERLRYFKNERWGIGSLYGSAAKPRRLRSVSSAIKQGKMAILKAEGKHDEEPEGIDFMRQFLARFQSGPPWCREVIDEYTRFIREELMGTLKQFLEAIERLEDKRKHSKNEEA
ncbi:MAG: hypothetical protein EA376_13900 [Phycisphaeraceae bacterium]|nr:MAG: hypothetical protein EA376_13900 [Phycisphaeraceae bacterium]